MSRRNIVDGESSETHALKNKLSSQDAQLAAQKTQLMKQADVLKDCQTSLNDALYKLNQETQRSLELERELKRLSEGNQGQRVASKNVEMSLDMARNMVKEKELELKELQSCLVTVSRTSEEHKLRATKLDREKCTLEARVRELEAETRKKPVPNAGMHRRTFSQPRSSSASEEKLMVLEKDLEDTRSRLMQTEADLHSTSQKLSQAQSNLVRVENEKAAGEKRMESQIAEITLLLEQKDGELQLMRSREEDGSREDELIKRIEEDEAKIAALETMLRGTQDIHDSEAQVRSVEARLAQEVEKVMEREKQCRDLARDRDEALDELAGAKAEIYRLAEIITEHDNNINCASEPRTDCPVNSSVESWPTTPLSQGQPDETTISYIERLLLAIDRLRSERDGLRRDVDFLESESKFTVESLEAKLSASMAARANIYQESRTREIETERIIERSTFIATANAIVISHLDFRNGQMESELQSRDQTVIDQGKKITELEAKLSENATQLQSLCDQKNNIQSQMARKELEWEEELQRLSRLNRSSLEVLERQVVDLSRTLESVESERNSLSLQVTNLTLELQSVQQELTTTESRYTSLRSQQLSTMSSTEANRALRDQLKEMEMRVARRTEQIGIHQHDIRRLETNLRLQEERLSEMTADLETLAAQKDAMVEDCADAREARDSALSRVEALEMELEALDAKLERSDKSLVSLVAVFMQSIGKVKGATKKAREKEEKLAQLLHAAYAHQQTLIKGSDDDKHTITTLQQNLEDSEGRVRLMGVVLAMLYVEARKTALVLNRLQEGRNQLDDQVKKLVEQRERLSLSTTSELEASRNEAAGNALRITELEARILELQRDINDRADEHRTITDELAHCKVKLEATMNDLEIHITEKHATDATLAEVKSRHAEELNSLERQLATISATAAELQEKLSSTEADKERMLSEFATKQQSLEQRIRSMSANDLQGSQAKDELLSLNKEYEEELLRLRNDYETTRLNYVSSQERIRDLELSYQRLSDELANADQSHNAELARVSDQSRATKEKLESDIALLNVQVNDNLRELEKSAQEIERLSGELDHLTEDHAQERDQYVQQLRATESQLKSAKDALKELEDRMTSALGDLDKSYEELEAVQKEKDSLQENMTNLEAELQRSVSKTRYLESQVKECKQSIATLTSDCDALRTELLQTEKLSKVAEVNLSLQSAQHKREMVELQKELDAIRSKPDLAAAVLELEERNNEMEDLLRKKCAEIEENDDKVLEILKENKKLTAKVESLNRKVQNLQAKLTAAKASIPKTEASLSVPFPSTSPVPTAPTVQFRPSTIPDDSAPLHKSTVCSVFTDGTTTSRSAHNASSLARSKTPERRLAHPTVFKAKSPDKRQPAPASEQKGSDQVIGKKRRAPEDFEVNEGIPPQGFTPDSIPEDQNENRTPRVRRILSGGLTSFTPIRRSHAAQPSPKRASIASVKTTSLIADVTNSPRGLPHGPGSGKNGKRSWLGKIRGNTTPRIVSSRTVSERLEDFS